MVPLSVVSQPAPVLPRQSTILGRDTTDRKNSSQLRLPIHPASPRVRRMVQPDLANHHDRTRSLTAPVVRHRDHPLGSEVSTSAATNHATEVNKNSPKSTSSTSIRKDNRNESARKVPSLPGTRRASRNTRRDRPQVPALILPRDKPVSNSPKPTPRVGFKFAFLL